MGSEREGLVVNMSDNGTLFRDEEPRVLGTMCEMAIETSFQIGSVIRAKFRYLARVNHAQPVAYPDQEYPVVVEFVEFRIDDQ